MSGEGKKVSDGGPAFPGLERIENYKHRDPDHEPPDIYYQSIPGMTLRQWYAGMALQLSGAYAIASILDGNKSTAKSFDKDDLAKTAVGIADALIAALKESP
jgi:hypothetical protein